MREREAAKAAAINAVRQAREDAAAAKRRAAAARFLGKRRAAWTKLPTRREAIAEALTAEAYASGALAVELVWARRYQQAQRCRVGEGGVSQARMWAERS